MRDLDLGDFLLEVRDPSVESLKVKCVDCLNQDDDLRAKIRGGALERYLFAMQAGKALSDVVAR